MLSLSLMGCNENAIEQQTAPERTEQQAARWAQTTIKHGTRLSYTANKIMLAGTPTDGAKDAPDAALHYKEVQEVSIFIDTEGRNYEEFSRVVDHSGRRDEYDPTKVAERVVRNGQITAFNNGGKALYALHPEDNGAKGSEENYGMLLMPCHERSQLILKQLSDVSKQGGRLLNEAGAKSAGSLSVEQLSESVLKLTQPLTDTRSGQEQRFIAVSYINTKYGVPVLSETYSEAGELLSRLTQLYKLVDSVPVLAYEESIFYTPDQNGQPIENKTITHYENIEIQKF